MNGHDALETNPHQKKSPRSVWSGVSPDDRLASPNDVKLTLRDLSGKNTVRACVSCVPLLSLGFYLCRGSLLSHRVWISDYSRRMHAALPVLLLPVFFNVLLCKVLFNAV
ncbi:trans-sialidase [Trypanosoma cruzi]|nr:trans-sialidase [Trypanosoma cruzi]